MTVRHVLIGLNLVAVVAIAGYLIWAVLSPKRASRGDRARQPHARSSPTRTSRAAGSNACRVGRCCSRRSSRSRCRSTGCTSRPGRRSRRPTSTRTRPSGARSCSRTRRCRSTNPPQSLQCANCHGAKGQGGPAPFAVDGKPVQSGRRRRSTPCSCASRRTRGASSPDDPAHVGVQRHRHHHLRPAGHADAGVGCRRRRPEERPVDPGSRRVPPHDPAHAGGGAEARPTKALAAAQSTDPTRLPAVHDVPGAAARRGARR